MKSSQSLVQNGVGNAVVNVGALTPHPRNYNQHSAGQVGDLRRSLRRFGQVRSIVVQAQAEPGRWLIVAGHGIVTAARAEGLTTLRADIIPADWDDAMVLAYLAADNELARQGQPDEAQLAALLRDVQAQADRELAALAAGSEARLTEMLATLDTVQGDAEPQVDRAAELQAKWQVSLGDVWRIGEHRLACGDCTDKVVVERVMRSEKADMVFTDPPYGIAYDGSNRPDKHSRQYEAILQNDGRGDLDQFAPMACSVCADLLRDGGVIYLFTAIVVYPEWRTPFEQHFTLRAIPIWVKDNPAAGRSDFFWGYEPMFYGTKGKVKHTWNGQRGKSDVWQFPSVNSFGYIKDDGTRNASNDAQAHPTQKPTALMAWGITLSSNPGDIVADPFLGSGTTLVACQNLHRRGRGIEISPDYCAVVLDRMATAFPGIEIERVTPRAKMDLDDENGQK